jgi:Coenzyme PQQ synthesis protein D (PqqD)
MKQNEERAPRARREGLVVQELADETLIYDRDRDKAHCLNQTAALVWKYCDGNTTVPKITRRLERELNAGSIDEKVVWYALDQLSNDHLLDESIAPPAILAGMTRREMMRALGVAAVVAVPLVTSIVAPTPAQASTCLPTGASCTSSAQCCSGLCNAGTCA